MSVRRKHLLFNFFYQTPSELPPPPPLFNRFFRKLCNYLQSGVVSKFPDNEQIKKNYAAIGGLLFLRFFCPAIFAPKTFGLVKGNEHEATKQERTTRTHASFSLHSSQKAHPRQPCARYYLSPKSCRCKPMAFCSLIRMRAT